MIALRIVKVSVCSQDAAARPLRIIASPDDPDFDEKIQAAIRQQLEAASSISNQQPGNPN